ncbi:MAG: hypothetical protein QOG45_2785 [Chloroflexota bacterium]|nr:hypothetical protein [Chloroflexota bacterium]
MPPVQGDEVAVGRADGLNGLNGSRTSPSQLVAIEAIGIVTTVAQDRGHCLGGFSRRSSQYGYRFVARCRACGYEVSVRADGGNGHSGPVPICTQNGEHRPAASLAAEDFLLAEIADLIETARRCTAVQDRVAALTQIERLSAWALRQCQQSGGDANGGGANGNGHHRPNGTL